MTEVTKPIFTETPTLFLDVDGVLNRCGASNQGLEQDKVQQLRRIVESSNPDIVVSSTWRRYDHQMERLTELLHSIGANVVGTTPILEFEHSGGIYSAKSRGAEIQAYIDEHGTPLSMVILDDMNDMEHLSPFLIQTKSFVGLTKEIADKVIGVLGDNPGTKVKQLNECPDEAL